MAIVPRAEAAPTTSRRRSPVFQGIVPVDRSRVPGDVIAGVTLAALGIPEVMGYTTIAGMPVITGPVPDPHPDRGVCAARFVTPPGRGGGLRVGGDPRGGTGG